MGRRDDDFRSYETPWLRRVLDDTFGLLGGAIMGVFRGVGHFVFLLVPAPLLWTGFIQSSLDDKRSKERTANALMGLPAVVVGVALIVVVALVASSPPQTLSSRYRAA